MNGVDCTCLWFRMSTLVLRCCETSCTKMCNFKLVKYNAILVIISIRGFAQKFEIVANAKYRPFLLEGRMRFFFIPIRVIWLMFPFSVADIFWVTWYVSHNSGSRTVESTLIPCIDPDESSAAHFHPHLKNKRSMSAMF